jgi:hypothetical protein
MQFAGSYSAREIKDSKSPAVLLKRVLEVPSRAGGCNCGLYSK